VRGALGDIAPLADLHASAEYRRRAAVSLATRAVADALGHAQGKKPMRIELDVNSTVHALGLSRAPRCSTACATCSISKAPMQVASTAPAAPAPCCSTASRCAPA
jgi:hypothetical protein